MPEVIPHGGRILVEAIEEEKGSIEMPDKVKDKYSRCRVVAVGPGRLLESGQLVPIPLKIGDEVVFQQEFGTPLYPRAWYGNRLLAIVDYEGVVAVVKREPGEKIEYAPAAASTPKIVTARAMPQNLQI